MSGEINLGVVLEIFAVVLTAIGSAVGSYIVIKSDLRIMMNDHAQIKEEVREVKKSLWEHITSHLHPPH